MSTALGWVLSGLLGALVCLVVFVILQMFWRIGGRDERGSMVLLVIIAVAFALLIVHATLVLRDAPDNVCYRTDTGELCP